MPRSALRKAAEYPPGPAPRTSTSQLMSAVPANRRGAFDTAAAGAAGAAGAEAAAPAATAATSATGAATGATAGAAADTGTPAAAPASISASTLPSDTLSPSFTRISTMRPATLAGISIEALSLSTVIRLCSSATSSPAFTRTSITSTSLKSPMSGTFNSIVAISCLLLAWRQSTARRKSPSRERKTLLKRAAAAPSITRWS
jgi:hypothetical protein